MKTKHRKVLIILTILALFVIVTYISYKLICKRFIYPIKYQKYVQKAASDNKIDPYIVFAIIKQESNFNKSAVSVKQAKGLMQIIDTTAKQIASEINYLDQNNLDLFDAKTNIDIGVRYFRSLVDRYNGNIKLAICAYNAGLGNVDKWILSENIYKNGTIVISNIPFEETKMYLVNIINYYNKYVELYR